VRAVPKVGEVSVGYCKLPVLTSSASPPHPCDGFRGVCGMFGTAAAIVIALLAWHHIAKFGLRHLLRLVGFAAVVIVVW
jgi:hypothetical protein